MAVESESVLRFSGKESLRLVVSLCLSSEKLIDKCVQGIGRNYRIAKCTAAKCALKALKKMDHKKRK